MREALTDDDRREVARRLREYVDLPDDWWQETCAEFYVEKCVFGNVDRHSEAELFTRLADLIEPGDSAQTVAEDMFGQMRHSTEQERIAYADMMARNSVELHTVDRDALLALARGGSTVRSAATGLQGHTVAEICWSAWPWYLLAVIVGALMALL